MNAIALRSDAQSMPAKIQYAKELANSGLLPTAFRRNPANVLFAVEYGDMLGLSPMAAITGIHVIEGKPSASAGLISALVRRAGHKLRVTGDSNSATCQIIRCDDPDYTFEVTWTLRKNGDGHPSAEEAGLLRKGTWTNYPASMLKSRAITQCARDACEEALFGLHYTPEELGAEVDEEGHVYGGTLTDEAPVPDEWFEQAIAKAKADDLTKDDVGKLWTEATARNKGGLLSDDSSRQLKLVLTSRAEEFKASEPEQAGEPEPDIVDAEFVETAETTETADPLAVYGLEPEDDWALTVASIADQDDADAAAADVVKQVGSGSMSAEHSVAVNAAIDARMAELNAKAAA
jgi:hypothetical protein